MKILKAAFAWLVSMALVACGGDSGNAGTSVFGNGSTTTPPTTSAAVSVDVLSSAVQLGSSGQGAVGAWIGFERTPPNTKSAGIIMPRLISDRGHLPITLVDAIKKNLETRVPGKHGWCNDFVARTTRKGNPREHRVR